ncbi:proton-conducting transporter membrane subunit [Corallococcus sp. bb12-1]|uniref:hydrogen gas-evolving membrane-bound hydrogenase subunit E n=1 Tax=Corallococcus sp. bb12-1 TaxID=2996784 RepID=UPI00226E73C0|nr:hydrogen gas-evolving membrane-bound hydrogenase subunit E [Corallococcus sp. bb12-1]MCY1041031.1 proton-conducting transporter membrane subunit [Corallococcus sp. bb12-1]
MPVLVLPILLSLACAPLAYFAGRWRPGAAAWVGAACAVAALAALCWELTLGPARLVLPWAPTWGLSLEFTRDGLSGLYAAMALSVGALVVLYSRAYMPHHLKEEGRPARDEVRFQVLMLSFMAAMVLLVTVDDLLLLFVALDLTTIVSYLLIGFDRDDPESRAAALLSLVLTGATSVVFFAGAMALGLQYDTFSLPLVFERAATQPASTGALVCLAVGALGKSAQVPFHFWLPRAMAAPTPVSSYLHSAAMVAAGVFLLQRLYPLFAPAVAVRDGLLAIGFLSMTVGSLMALVADPFKRVLAYSTIAQYGYALVLVALGSEGAPLYVAAHAPCKAALFLTVGAITQVTGKKKLSEVSGLRHSLPVLAGASAVGAAGLAALPFTVGFFKDEVFFHALVEKGPLFMAAGLVGAGLTLAYTLRLWWGLFGGPRQDAPAAPRLLVAPVVVLAASVLVGGLLPGLLVAPSRAAAAASMVHGGTSTLALAYHLDARAENLLAVGAWALGAALFATRRAWTPLLTRVLEGTSQVGPAHGYRVLLHQLDRLSTWLHEKEVRDLRDRVASVLVPTGLLGMTVLWVTPLRDRFITGSVGWADVTLVMALAFASAAALATLRARNHLVLVMLISCVGFSLAMVFAFAAAPDVALTSVLVETTFTLLFAGLLALLPDRRLERAQQEAQKPRGRDRISAGIAGASAFLLSWSALSHLQADRVGTQTVKLAEAAHSPNVVAAVLTDFRGLDTVGEMSVVLAALLGVTSLLKLKGKG